MQPALIAPANAAFVGIPAKIIFILIPLVGIAVFAYIMKHRIEPLLQAAPGPTLQPLSGTHPGRHQNLARPVAPSALSAGRRAAHHRLLRILTLAARSTQLVVLGFAADFSLPGFGGAFGHFYSVLKDYAGTAVFICAVILAVRRLAFKPARYDVPERYGQDHTPRPSWCWG